MPFDQTSVKRGLGGGARASRPAQGSSVRLAGHTYRAPFLPFSGTKVKALKAGVDILIATPGRLLDLMSQGHCKLSDVDILVLDEADRMLDMGFLPDVRRIVQQCPAARQTLFFTATLPPEIASLAGWALRDPVEIKIGARRSAAETVAHAFYPVVATQKFDLLLELLRRTEFKSVIIFTRTRMGADRIAARL